MTACTTHLTQCSIAAPKRSEGPRTGAGHGSVPRGAADGSPPCAPAMHTGLVSTNRAEDLLYLLELARAGRVVEAARRMGVRHTTVARRISALEKRTGRRLVHKTSHGWLLTDDGEELLKYAESIESTLHLVDAQLRGGATRGLGGTVRIAAQDGIGATVIADAVVEIRRAHPRLEVELTTATRRFDISSRDYDVSVTLQHPRMNQFAVRRLTDYRLGLYATPAYLEEHSSIRRPEDLADHTVVWYIESLLDLPELESFDNKIFYSRPALRSSNIFAQLRFVKSHGGVGLLPGYLVDDDPATLRPVLPTEVSVQRTFWMVTRKDSLDSVRVRTVVDFLTQYVQAARSRFL